MRARLWLFVSAPALDHQVQASQVERLVRLAAGDFRNLNLPVDRADVCAGGEVLRAGVVESQVQVVFAGRDVSMRKEPSSPNRTT